MSTAMSTGTAMTDGAALYKLLAWLSPGYPIGAYSYSHGLEYAVHAGHIADADDCMRWLQDILERGAGVADAILLAGAWRAADAGDAEQLAGIAEYAAAFAGTGELALESHAQGAAFLKITSEAWNTPALDLLTGCWDGPYAYPIVVACAAAGHRIGLEDAAAGYLHALAANLISAALRLVPLGQTDGQKITAALEPVCLTTAREAIAAPLTRISNACLIGEISSMKHETQHTRLFRS